MINPIFSRFDAKFTLPLVLMVLINACSTSSKKTAESSGAEDYADELVLDDEGSETLKPSPIKPLKETEKVDKWAMQNDDKEVESGSFTKNVSAAENPSEYKALKDAVMDGDEKRSLLVAERLLGKNPKDATVFNLMAVLYLKKNKLRTAQLYVDKGLSFSPNDADLLNNLGVLGLKKEEDREAILSFKMALQKDSRHPVASMNLGSLYAAGKNYSKARIPLDQAYKAGIKNPDLLNNYAVTMAALGKSYDAHKAYDEALKVKDNDVRVLINKGIFLAKVKGEKEEARELLDRIKFIGFPRDYRTSVERLENLVR